MPVPPEDRQRERLGPALSSAADAERRLADLLDSVDAAGLSAAQEPTFVAPTADLHFREQAAYANATGAFMAGVVIALRLAATSQRGAIELLALIRSSAIHDATRSVDNAALIEGLLP